MRLAVCALWIAACGDNAPATPPAPDQFIENCDNGVPDSGVYASDENFTAFVNKEAAGAVVKDCTKAPQLTTPAPGGTLDPAAPPAVSFLDTPTTCKSCKPKLQLAACKLTRQPLWKRLLRAFVLEGVAEAHCGAFTGTNYLLRLTHAGDAAPVYMAELSVTSFTPDATIWSTKLGAHRGQTLQMTIERAVFFRGDIMEGPFVQPTPYAFTVKP